MRKHARIAVSVGLIIMLLIMGINIATAQRPESSIVNAPSSWYSQYIHHVDYPNNVGDYVSIAWNPIERVPFVSYYDYTNGDLMLAHYVTHGGNCGTDNHWYCESIDTEGNVGAATSIDIWEVDSDSYKVGISYHDVANGDLKYISWTCHPLSCTIKNDVIVRSSPSVYISVGDYTSMKFTPNGTPHIAYYRSNSLGNETLGYASYVGSGGNCGEGTSAGKWQCDTIDYAEGVGQYVSLDLTYDGSPYLAYYDAHNGNLKVAYYLGIADPDCYAENGWYCPIIDSTGDVGKYASITAQHQIGDQIFRIAYYDATNHHLKYYDPEFGAVMVDDMGTSIYRMGISMDIDPNGYPNIAYQKISSEFSPPTLRIAKPYLQFSDGNFGNCGDVPPGYLFQYWRCNTLDNAGQYYSEAEYVSMEINPYGSPQIAYSEFFDYDMTDNAMSLKFISEVLQQNVLPLVLR